MIFRGLLRSLVNVSTPAASLYPNSAGARSRWVAMKRPPKAQLDPWKPYAFLWEEEAGTGGDLISTATIFLTNRECPYRCLMCDLWKNTLDEPVPPGAIAAQIRHALDQLPPARQIKLYNAGSFFDPQAIPVDDYPEIAEAVSHFERVIVESHPRLIGARVLRLRDLVNGDLEVAIGLETVHPEVLQKLNKRFTLTDFEKAAGFLATNGIALRVFILLRPPFLSEEEGVVWAKKSLDCAFQCGAAACAVIPTRSGNGALESLTMVGQFAQPQLRSLETVQEYGLTLARGRVFSDLWDIERFYSCSCSPARNARLGAMNRTQKIPAPILCAPCEVAA
jgi:radical SAM enzyme (TIGR01210 family)